MFVYGCEYVYLLVLSFLFVSCVFLIVLPAEGRRKLSQSGKRKPSGPLHLSAASPSISADVAEMEPMMAP